MSTNTKLFIPNGKKLRAKYELNVQGATFGGVIGLAIGLATKKNLIVSVIIGLVAGRVIFKK